MKYFRYALSLLEMDLNRAAHVGAGALVAYTPFWHDWATLFIAGVFWAVMRSLGFLAQANAGPPQ